MGVGRWSAGGEGVLFGTFGCAALPDASEGPVGDVGERVEATDDG